MPKKAPHIPKKAMRLWRLLLNIITLNFALKCKVALFKARNKAIKRIQPFLVLHHQKHF